MPLSARKRSIESSSRSLAKRPRDGLAASPARGRFAQDRDDDSIDRFLADKGIQPIDFAGWKRIDAYERAEGAKVGREHIKVIDPDQLRQLAHGE